MTNAILRGKPDAGNSHVRFDEGEVASAEPRRGSLLYKRLVGVLAAVFAPIAVWASEEWIGTGADTKITTVGNWASATDLTGGTAVMKVTGGSAATLPADGTDYAFKGVSAETVGFAFDAEAGARPVTLGAGGFTNTVSGVTWAWPAVLGTDQVWYSGSGALMDVHANIGGTGTWTFYGKGRVNWYGTNTFSGTVNLGTGNSGDISQSCLHLYPDAKLAGSSGTVKVGSGGNSYGLWLHGVTMNSALVVGTANSTTRMGVYSDEGVTNVINGKLSTQYSNNAFWGLKGVTICRGGVALQTDSDNKQQRINPFASAKAVFRVEQSPMRTHLMELSQGRLELAVENNAFQSLGLRIVGGTFKTEVPYASKAQNATAIASANSIGLRSGTWDLGGGDQSVDYFFGEGGTITSATDAQLHDIVSAAQPNRAQKSDVYSNFGQDVTVCKSVFTGGAGLAKEGALDLYIAAANTSTGRLTATAGRLILSAANSAAKFPGTSFTKTQGSWAGRVEVTGGTLVIEHAAALGPKSEVYVSGGSVEIAEGVVLPAMALYVADGEGGWTPYRGICGGAASGAAQQPTLPGGAPVFSGRGTICVGATLPDGWPTTASFANWVEQGADNLVTTAANWDPSTASVHDGSLFARIAAGTQAKLADNDFAFIQGLAVSQPNFTFATGSGTTLFLGNAGLTNQATGVVWNWPASIGAFEPIWWLAKDSTMDLRAPISGSGTLNVWGGGRLDVYSTNTVTGTVYVGNNNGQSANPMGEVYVYLHPGATLAGAGGTVSIGCRSGWGLHLMGNTLDCNVIAGTQNNTTPAALFVEKDTTNVINGLFQTQFANVSSMSLKGTLVLRGGAEIQTVGSNPYNSGGYFTFWNSSDCTGTLRIEEKPLHSSRIHLPRGMIDLATTGNQLRLCGLRIIGGTFRTSVPYAIDEQPTEANRNIVYLESGAWDLAGNDQRIEYFHGKGGQVTSASLAQLHLKNDQYWKCSKTPALSFGATGTVCQTSFTGGAGLRKEGSLDLYIAAVNSSTGTLTVTKGKLVMSGYSATATYPGTTIKKSYGAWRAGTVEVMGGTLLVEHKEAFTRETTLVVAGGTVELATGVRAKVGALVVGGETLGAGVYGGPQSAAPNKLDCFSGTGVIRVGEVGLKVIVAGVPG